MRTRSAAMIAALLTVTGELELLLGSFDDTERLVSCLALPGVTAPLAWSVRAAVPALGVIATVLAAQVALGGVLAGSVVTTVVVLAVALCLAGRDASSAWGLAMTVAGASLVAAARIVSDPAARPAREAVMTCLAVAAPLVVGRWARNQGMLQRELAATAARRLRERTRDAEHAAEAERARIAADLQIAVAGGLRQIAEMAGRLDADLRAGDPRAARERVLDIAGRARTALADVRRVLGVLRRDGEAVWRAPRTASAPPLKAPATTEAGTATVAPTRERGLGIPPQLPVAAVLAVAATELALVAPGVAPLTAGAIAAPLLWRRRFPVLAAAAVLAAVAVQSQVLTLERFPLGDSLAMVVATYAIGAHSGGRRAVPGMILIATAATAHAAVFYPDGVVAAPLGGVALPWTIGRIVRGNRRLTFEGRQRNVEIERERAREEAAVVTRERLRVARELHDAVAHNLTVIAIQAGGAEGLLGRDDQRAADCARLIATVAAEALAELGRLTGVTAAAGPSLRQLDDLVDRARSSGLAVFVSVEGSAPALPAGVDLTAFRIIQEALANTAKHARADRAWVTVRFPPRAVELQVADDGQGPRRGGPSPEGSGHGLVGMRERVTLYNGSLDVGRHSSGGFLVRARIPIESS